MFHGKLLICVALGVVGAAAAAPVAGEAAKSWRESRAAHSPLGQFISGQVGRWMVLRSELNLTDEQRAQIRDVLKGHKSDIAKTVKAVFEKKIALREAMLAGTPDETAIRKAADDLGKVAGDAAVFAAKLVGEIRPILTTEQQSQIEHTLNECEDATLRFLDRAAEGA